MTRDEFLAAAGQLYDAMHAGTGGGKPPKFDTPLPRGNNKVSWASECSVKELRYWKERFDKPPSDPKYVESNQKRSRAIGLWLSYRQSNPTEQWRGERNRQTVTAAAPSDRPEQYDKDAAPAPAPPASGDDSDIPF